MADEPVTVTRFASGLGALGLPKKQSPSCVYLHPGQSFASAAPSQISMILGSCVAVLLWDYELKIGGATHYMLPHNEDHDARSARYGSVAIEELHQLMRGLGCRDAHLTAKVFGGAAVLAALQGNGSNHIGAKNVEVALKLLYEKGIAVVERSVGGTRGRKVLFKTQEGMATVTEF